VFLKCLVPDYILVLIEVAIKNIAYLVAIEVNCVDEFDQCLGLIQGQSSNSVICCATTVAVERDPHQVHSPNRIDIEISKDAPAVKAQAKAARPGSCWPNVFGYLHGSPPSVEIDPPNVQNILFTEC
jgi:hypothetical protein